MIWKYGRIDSYNLIKIKNIKTCRTLRWNGENDEIINFIIWNHSLNHSSQALHNGRSLWSTRVMSNHCYTSPSTCIHCVQSTKNVGSFHCSTIMRFIVCSHIVHKNVFIFGSPVISELLRDKRDDFKNYLYFTVYIAVNCPYLHNAVFFLFVQLFRDHNFLGFLKTTPTWCDNIIITIEQKYTTKKVLKKDFFNML